MKIVKTETRNNESEKNNNNKSEFRNRESSVNEKNRQTYFFTFLFR